MQLRASTSRRWLGFVLTLGMAACGDTPSSDQTDEAADSATQSGGSGESGGGIEGGGEGGSGEGGEGGSGEGVEGGTAEASEAADMADASMSESAGEASGSASESETTLASTTETETGEMPIDCATVGELECPLVANCVAYVGQPFAESIDGMLCLGPPQFLGCMFADMACLPATGTLCSGDQVFHVDNLCLLPEGFEPCEPPIDPPPANCP